MRASKPFLERHLEDLTDSVEAAAYIAAAAEDSPEAFHTAVDDVVQARRNTYRSPYGFVEDIAFKKVLKELGDRVTELEQSGQLCPWCRGTLEHLRESPLYADMFRNRPACKHPKAPIAQR